MDDIKLVRLYLELQMINSTFGLMDDDFKEVYDDIENALNKIAVIIEKNKK